MLNDLIASGGDLSKICTTYISDLSNSQNNSVSLFGSNSSNPDEFNNIHNNQTPSIASWDVSNVTNMERMLFLKLHSTKIYLIGMLVV